MRHNNYAMKVKSILSLTVFIAAFFISAALVSLTVAETPVSVYEISPVRADDATRLNIVRFLEKDVRNGIARDRRTYKLRTNNVSSEEFFAARTEIITRYVDESSALDESKLPQDLQIAWLKHMRAWHNYADYLKENEAHLQYDDAARQFNREINATWFEVLKIGRTYGATVREY